MVPKCSNIDHLVLLLDGSKQETDLLVALHNGLYDRNLLFALPVVLFVSQHQHLLQFAYVGLADML